MSVAIVSMCLTGRDDNKDCQYIRSLTKRGILPQPCIPSKKGKGRAMYLKADLEDWYRGLNNGTKNLGTGSNLTPRYSL